MMLWVKGRYGGRQPEGGLWDASRVCPWVRCKVPKGGSSGGTGIPLQPMGVEPGIAKTIYVE